MTMWDFFNTLLNGGYPLANLLVAMLVVVLFAFLFRKAILVVLMKKLDIPTKTELKENEFFHLHKGILLLAKALKITPEDYKRLYDNAVEDVEKIRVIDAVNLTGLFLGGFCQSPLSCPKHLKGGGCFQAVFRT